MLLVEATSVYLAKLNQFLADEDPTVARWIKDVLNKIFVGIEKDFGGYIEGKRPTVKDFGDHRIFKMMIQAQSDVKKDSNDEPGKWNFHYPIKDYCSSMGKIVDKKIDGDQYQCVLYQNDQDLDDTTSWKEFEKKTDLAAYPAVGVYETGIGGSYKNLTKDVPGTTYSVIVSLPVSQADALPVNKFLTKSGTSYTLANDHHDEKDGSDSYTVRFDASDGEFVITKYQEGSADRYTAIYRGSRDPFRVFRGLCDIFDANTSAGQVSTFLTDNGVRLKHSWWFNPYTD